MGLKQHMQQYHPQQVMLGIDCYLRIDLMLGLYKNILKINWEEYFELDNTFATHATTNSEVFNHSKYASLLVKDGIADFFRNKHNKRPNVDADNPDVTINLHVNKSYLDDPIEA